VRAVEPIRKEANIERLSAKVWNNWFNRTRCSKRSAVFALFLVLPGRVETKLGYSETVGGVFILVSNGRKIIKIYQ